MIGKVAKCELLARFLFLVDEQLSKYRSIYYLIYRYWVYVNSTLIWLRLFYVTKFVRYNYNLLSCVQSCLFLFIYFIVDLVLYLCHTIFDLFRKYYILTRNTTQVNLDRQRVPLIRFIHIQGFLNNFSIFYITIM